MRYEGLGMKVGIAVVMRQMLSPPHEMIRVSSLKHAINFLGIKGSHSLYDKWTGGLINFHIKDQFVKPFILILISIKKL